MARVDQRGEGRVEASNNSQTTVQIENVVATTDIEQEIDLQQLAMNLSGSNYDPAKFPGLVFSPDDVPATVLIFRSGKMVSAGATNVSDSHESVHIVFDYLRDIGIEVGYSPDVTVTNVVSTTDFGQKLNLASITIALGLESTEYEPEQFPGLIYRPDDHEVVILTFGTGKMVITGARNFEEAEQAVESYRLELDGMGCSTNSRSDPTNCVPPIINIASSLVSNHSGIGRPPALTLVSALRGTTRSGGENWQNKRESLITPASSQVLPDKG